MTASIEVPEKESHELSFMSAAESGSVQPPPLVFRGMLWGIIFSLPLWMLIWLAVRFAEAATSYFQRGTLPFSK